MVKVYEKTMDGSVVYIVCRLGSSAVCEGRGENSAKLDATVYVRGGKIASA